MNAVYILGLVCLGAFVAYGSDERAAGESVPRESPPGESAPGESVPRESPPGESAPGESVPRESAAGEREHGYGHGYGYGRGREHGHGHGHGRGRGHFRSINFKICFDDAKVKSEAAKADLPQCKALANPETTPAPGSERGRGRGKHFVVMKCLMKAFEMVNANNETVVANIVNSINAVAVDGKASEIATAYQGCADKAASGAATLNRELSMQAGKCYMDALKTICPRQVATTMAP